MRIVNLSGAAALLASLALVPAAPATAVTLVEFNYGTGTGTNLADTVAAHASVTPTQVYGNVGQLLAHSFIDVGGGDMAIHSKNAEGNDAHAFRFTLTAAPGYRLKITDMAIAWGVSTYSGGSWSLSLWPNAEQAQALTMFSGAGLYAGGLSSPGVWYWNTGQWDLLMSRDDLHALTLQFGAGGSVLSAYVNHVMISGEVLPVPEPSSMLLISAGLGALLLWRRRQCEQEDTAPAG